MAAVLDVKQTASVGLEYIEELAGAGGKGVMFHCRLCECNFTDRSARDMHAKGRRHRLQYKVIHPLYCLPRNLTESYKYSV